MADRDNSLLASPTRRAFLATAAAALATGAVSSQDTPCTSDVDYSSVVTSFEKPVTADTLFSAKSISNTGKGVRLTEDRSGLFFSPTARP